MRTLLVICSIMLLLGACSTMEVQHSADSSKVMPSYSTFAWIEPAENGSQVRAPEPSVDRFIRQAVERELVVKGYSRGEPETADFLISWFGRLDEKVQRQDISHFYSSYGYGSALAATMPGKVEEAAVKRTYEEGTLVIEVVDRASGNRVWRGSATETIVRKIDEREEAMIINKAVREIMRPFPGR